jgi:type I restriction enzyme S subunit
MSAARLAALPSGWRRVQLRALSGIPITAGVDWVADPLVSELVRYIRTTDIAGLRTLIPSTEAVGVPLEVASQAPVERGDLLLTRSGSLGTSLLYDSDDPAAYAGYLVRVRPISARVESRFVAWWSLSRDHLDQISMGATKSTIDNFSASKFRSMMVPLPERDEQVAIADFLDCETAKIDALIGKQKRLLDRLRERRVELVRHAIEGLELKEPRSMRSASWLGPVPSTWSTRPLWSMFRREKRTGYVAEPMVSVFREYGVVFKGNFDNLNVTAEDRSIYQLIEPGWLVINRMKAWQGSVGVSNIRGIVSGHYICFRPNHRENPQFLNLLFRSPQYRDGFATNSRGVRPGQAEIDNDLLRKMPVLLPTAGEQAKIVAYVDARTADIDRLALRATRLIDLATERRAALITSAVTGQLNISTGKVA